MVTVYVAEATVSLPMPLYLLIEDVGWWRGGDGSAYQEPYRNRFSRDHCLADYEALTALARRLSMRIGLGMVLGEWDRNDCLQDVPGATWMGKDWTNSRNRGPWLDEVAGYLNDNREYLEITLHGLCHEFWEDGVMQRSEFHDAVGLMRPAHIIRGHLDAFAAILAQNGVDTFPRLFVPPALYHSFGNGRQSFQAILGEYGIRYVITRFARARQYSSPLHDRITWEEGVLLLERGMSPVSWEVPAAVPPLHVSGPVIALHWANLLHPDSARNIDVITVWADAIAAAADNLGTVLARDVADCFQQAAAYYLADMSVGHGCVKIDLQRLPSLVSLTGPIRIKVQDNRKRRWICRGGRILRCLVDAGGAQTLEVLPDPRLKKLQLSPLGE